VTDTPALLGPPVLLTEAHDSSAFDSGEPVLDGWLRHRAWDNLRVAASPTYVVCPKGSHGIAGYFVLSMGQILAHEASGSMRRNMPKQIPAVMLGRLAIDRAWQGKGLGRALLTDAVRRSLRASSEVLARLVIVHVISPAAEAFYVHHGFTRPGGGDPNARAFELGAFELCGSQGRLPAGIKVEDHAPPAATGSQRNGRRSAASVLKACLKRSKRNVNLIASLPAKSPALPKRPEAIAVSDTPAMGVC
jgi:GNAT superfamily N-acetyltransferase